MMKKFNLTIRYIFVCVLGVLLHFLYNLSGYNRIVGLFSAVNESTFEHLKLIFFPMLFLTLWDVFKLKKSDNEFLVKRTTGLLCGMFSIVFLFYTTWGVLGTRYDPVNIAIYFVGVLIAFYTENSGSYHISISNITCIVIFLYLALAFFMFTYHSPNVGIFFDFEGVGPKDYFR